MKHGRDWVCLCGLEDILPMAGVCALIDGEQVAVFRMRDELYALGNRDPFSGANVLSRGIVGDLGGALVVASPIYKQHFDLRTGQCLEDAAVSVPVWNVRLIEGEVWVRRRKPASETPRRRLVVIGSGMAALSTIEELLRHDASMYDITLFGAEPSCGYNRVLLSPLLAGEKRHEEIVTHPLTWFAEQGIELHLNDPVTGVDRARRVVRTASGIEAPYDRLLLATGAHPVKLDIPGASLPGIVSFRDLHDVATMIEAAGRYRHAVVVGGGVLGLEAAHGLQRQGMQVSVVHAADRLMNRQLDEHTSSLLQAEFEQRGMRLHLGVRPVAMSGEDRVREVQLDDGQRLAADLVVVAIGVRPDTTLARACGLQCDAGVLVDDTLQTFDPAIYAVGDCVQHRRSTYGLIAPLQSQARVCAAHLADRGVVRFPGARLATQLKVKGVQLFAAGDPGGGGAREDLVLRDPQRGVYRRLVLQDNRVQGAVLFGDTRDGGWYLDLIDRQTDVGPIRDRLLLGEVSCQPRP